jgi:hypothetical protein
MQVNVPGEAIPIALFVMAGITMIGYPIARALAKRIENKASNPRLRDRVNRRRNRTHQRGTAIHDQAAR